MRFLSVVLFFLALCDYNHAQTKNIDLDLNSDIVKDVLQQDSGLIWVGTDEGLNVFFDNEKEVFYANIQDSLSVLNSDIDDIKIDSKNNLIILTRDGISIFNSNTFNFKQLKLNSKPTSVGEDINSGELWVSTENSGYYLINKDQEIDQHFKFDPLSPLSISSSSFSDGSKNKIVLSDSLSVFIATQNGFNVYNRKLKTFRRYFKGEQSKLSTNVIVGVQYFKNKILVASENEVVTFNPESSRFKKIFSPKEKINSFISINNEIPPILSTANYDYKLDFNAEILNFEPLKDKVMGPNHSVFKTKENILFWKKGSSEIIQTELNFTNKSILNINNPINSLSLGLGGEIFIGTNNGVKTLSNEKVFVQKISNYDGSNFFSIIDNKYVNIKDNTVELGYINSENSSFFKKKYSHNFSNKNFEINNGFVYMAEKELLIFDIENKKLINSNTLNEYLKGKIIDNLKIIDDFLYASFDNGLVSIPLQLIEPQKNYTSSTVKNEIILNEYNELLNKDVPRGFNDIEKVGNLFYVTNEQTSLSVYKDNFNSLITNYSFNGDSSVSLASSSPTKLMYLEKEKELYIGSIGSGLFKFNIEDKTFINIKSDQGLLSNNVYDFLETNERLYIQSGSGVNYLENNLIKNINIEDGLSNDIFHRESLHLNRDNIFISGNNSLQSFYHKDLDNKQNRFNISVFNIIGIDEFNNKVIVSKDENGVYNIDYKIKTLLVDLFPDNIYKSDQVQYFLIRNNANEIISNGYNNKLQLNALPYYTSNLDFYAINGSGEKSNNIVSLSVYNAPPWWLRIESIVGYIILLIISITLFVRYKDKKTKEKMEGERKAKELEEAKELQNSLLPKVLPNVNGFEISTYLKPATEIGGDYYDFFYKKDNYFYAICGDATGHGVVSGIMVSVTKAGLNGIPMGDPSTILGQLNKIVKRVNFGRLRMSLSVAKFNKNSVELSSAAMPPTYHFSSKTKKMEEILVPNLPLGGIETEKFDGVKKEFDQGDVMVMISDGLPELPNPTDEMLDYEKVYSCIKDNAEKSANEIKDALVYLSDDWAKGVMNPDDITIVVIKKAA